MAKFSSKDWSWEGGRPAIDLLNTLRDRKRTPRELLVAPSDLAEWLIEARLLAPTVRTAERHLERARALRDAIDRLTLAAASKGAIDARDVDTLNAFARVRPSAPALAIGNDGALEAQTPDEKDPVSVAFGKIAADAIDLVTSQPEALRICASATCGLRFEDRSPAGNRQWCSMKRCGNREKARQHYLRSK